MKHLLIITCLCSLKAANCTAESPKILFDGNNLDAWDFNAGSWVIDPDGAMTCRMEKVKQKDGSIKQRGKGYIWTKNNYDNFKLTLSYKLSEAANSGVFFRTDKENPVQGGFEVQLVDNQGFQKVKGKKDPKNLNGAFYDCQPATSNPQKAIGQWNQLRLTCNGSNLTIEINDVVVNEVDISEWDKPRMNPDGSANKFKTALNKLPQTGRIGFQNHGQVVWFKDVKILSL